MITPADVARMHANAAVNHALSLDDPDFDPLVPDELMYTSQTTTVHLNTVLDEAGAVKAKLRAERIESASTQAAHMPTPADMPSHPTAHEAVQEQSGPSEDPVPNQAHDTRHAPTPAQVAQAAHAARMMQSLHATQPLYSSQPVPAQSTAVPAHPMRNAAPRDTGKPTPAMMPQRRSSERRSSFASLDAQELPVVREYSAGGLVFDAHGRVAIIARHSRSGHLEWCLPKGHIEKGETPQQTAVREIHEETGIIGEVVDSIATIDYWFTGTSQRVHKLVHHFALRQTGGELTVEGDPDHEAEDAIWVDFADLDDVLSYPNERKIAWLYARKLNRQA